MNEQKRGRFQTFGTDGLHYNHSDPTEPNEGYHMNAHNATTCFRRQPLVSLEILSFTVLFILTELHFFPVIFCFVHFLLIGQTLWAWLSICLMLPGSVVQVLSFKWYMSDAKKGRKSLIIIHVLHMGIFIR